MPKTQKNTQNKKEPTKSQKNTKTTLQALIKEIYNLGARWGIFVEEEFKASMKDRLKEKFKINVQELLIGEYQLHLLIKDNEHILVEIISSTKKKNVEKLLAARRLYKQKKNVEPKLILLTAFIPPKLYEFVKEHNIQIMSHDE